MPPSATKVLQNYYINALWANQLSVILKQERNSVQNATEEQGFGQSNDTMDWREDGNLFIKSNVVSNVEYSPRQVL